MKKLLTLGALAALALSSTVLASAGGPRASIESAGDDPVTLAVFGDAPYSNAAADFTKTPPNETSEIDAFPAFVDAVNKDSSVKSVLFVGDIHSGKQPCTLAYNLAIAKLWTGFRVPLIYTPGDNEWTDCHKPGQGGDFKVGPNVAADGRIWNSTLQGYMDFKNPGFVWRNSRDGWVPIGNANLGIIDGVSYVDYANGNPVANLALVRQIFFSKPGEALGGGQKKVTSQAQAFDPKYPSDAEYVENVMWEQAGVLFVAINVPGGSNNDSDPWYGAPVTAEQVQEQAQRTSADIRWLDAAFAQATADKLAGVVILTQGDMWDLDGKTLASAHLDNLEPIISDIATRTLAFAKPVLLFNGDSHFYRSDNPLMNDAPCVIETGPTATAACATVAATPTLPDGFDTHPNLSSLNVPNFHRLVVHGSTLPFEYLRFSVNTQRPPAAGPNSFGPFSWERIVP